MPVHEVEMLNEERAVCTFLWAAEDEEGIAFALNGFTRSLRRRGRSFWIGLSLFIVVVNTAIFLLPSAARDAREVELGSELQLSSWLDMKFRENHDKDISKR